MDLAIPAIRFKQKTVPMYIAVVSPKDLSHFSIDRWNPKSVVGKRGYQRTLDEDRIKKIAKYFEHREAMMPVAGLLNIREKKRLRYVRHQLVIPEGTDIWVVDMQHRLHGILTAKEHGLLNEDFGVPVVITEGLTQASEA
jgi:DGQHR domain-containing protein